MRAIDTDVLIRVLTGDEPRQCAIGESFIEDGAWVSIPVLLESLWTLGSVYRQDAAAIARVVAMLLVHDRLILQDADAVTAALEEFRSRRSVGFSDCLILVLARKAGHLPLGTFDKSLAKLTGAQRL